MFIDFVQVIYVETFKLLVPDFSNFVKLYRSSYKLLAYSHKHYQNRNSNCQYWLAERVETELWTQGTTLEKKKKRKKKKGSYYRLWKFVKYVNLKHLEM